MPRKKTATVKSTPAKPAAAKVNKSAWIRSQPASAPAKDVLAKAKAEGIKLSLAQVYTARSTAKKPAGKPGRPKGSAAAAPKAATKSVGDESMFKRLVLSIGLTRAEAYLSDLKRSVGL